MMADYSSGCEITYNDGPPSCTIRFRCFDTPNSVTAFGCGNPDYDVEELLLKVRRRCLKLHFLWSFSLPESDIARINQPCDSVEVDEGTARLLRAMKGFHDAEPAFDFTVGPVSFLWKHASSVPGDDDIRSALEHVGADKVSIEGRTVVKHDPLVQVDVGGAAKGFAADEIAAMLRDAGVTCADVDLGGNLYMLGSHPSGRPWRVSVRDPRSEPAGSAAILEVVDRSVVTSGTYERFFTVDGVTYHHILDPKTGLPAQSDLAGATIVGDSSMDADALATACIVLGREKALEMLNKNGFDGVLIDVDGGVYLTDHLSEKYAVKMMNQ